MIKSWVYQEQQNGMNQKVKSSAFIEVVARQINRKERRKKVYKKEEKDGDDRYFKWVT